MNESILRTTITLATLGATRMRLRMMAELSGGASVEEITLAHDSMHFYIDMANRAQAQLCGLSVEA